MILLFSFALVFASCSGDGAVPSFDMSLKRADDDVELYLSERAATFLITSITGIGEVHITSSEDQWPDTMRIQFQYEGGRGFHRLESFTVQSDSLLARTSLGRPGTVPLYCIKVHTKIDSSAICGETAVPLKKRHDFVEATIPQVFLGKGTSRLTISWIDMYRR